MRLHLPVALLAAVVSAVSYGAEIPTYKDYVYSETNGTSALFSKDTSIWFTGDWTGCLFNAKNPVPHNQDTGYFDSDQNGGKFNTSTVGGLMPTSGTETANNISIKVGTAAEDTPEKTIIGTVIGVGYGGYAASGNKNILITGSSSAADDNYTYVGTIIGGNQLGDGTAGNYCDGSYEVNEVNTGSLRFAKKTDTDKTIAIHVEGGVVGQIRGGSSSHTGKIDTAIKSAWVHYKGLYGDTAEAREAVEAYIDNGPWIRNEKVEISITGDSKVGYNQNGGEFEAGAEASIYGAGGTAHSINNTVSINIGGNADIIGNVLGGALSKNYNVSGYGSAQVNSYVNGTKITIADNATVHGNVYGGGYSKSGSTSIVKGDTCVTLAGGTIDGNVYGAGNGDLVLGNTKVVIQGAGSTVNGTIYGGGVNNTSEIRGGEQILAFNEYTGNSVTRNAAATVDWNKYANFNALEVTNTDNIELGTVDAAYKKMSISGSNVHATSVGQTAIVSASGSTLAADNDDINIAAGSTIADSSFTASTGNILVGENSTFTNTNFTAESGTVTFNKSMMKEGNITAKHLVVSGISSNPAPGGNPNYNSIIANDVNIAQGGSITNDHGKLYVKGTANLNDVDVTVTNSKLPKSESIYTQMQGTVTATNGTTFNVEGASLRFSKASVVDADSSTIFNVKGSYNTDGELVRKGDMQLYGVLTAEQGSQFNITDGQVNLASGSTTTIGGEVNISSTGKLTASSSVLNATEGSAFTNNGGTLQFSKLNANGSTITSTGGTTQFDKDVSLNNTNITIENGAQTKFKGNVTLTGNNTLEIKGDGDLGFAFENETKTTTTFIPNPGTTTSTAVVVTEIVEKHTLTVDGGENKIVGPVTVDSDIDVKGGILNISSTPKDGSSSTKPIVLHGDVRVADGATVNVTANRGGALRITGNATISNLTIDSASTADENNASWLTGRVSVTKSLNIKNTASDNETHNFAGGLELLDSTTISVEDGATLQLTDVAVTATEWSETEGVLDKLLEASDKINFAADAQISISLSDALIDSMQKHVATDLELILWSGQTENAETLAWLTELVTLDLSGFDTVDGMGITFNSETSSYTLSANVTVPEPTTATLSLLALAALAARRRRK